MQAHGRNMPFLGLTELDCEFMDAAQEQGAESVSIMFMGNGSKTTTINFKQLEQDYNHLINIK